MAETSKTACARAFDSSWLCLDLLGVVRGDTVNEVRSNGRIHYRHAHLTILRAGDKHKTNRMFRRRIYAQGFTILAMVAGSAYWESDRSKRKQYGDLVEEKKKKDKHEAWIKELEIRDAEDEELRRMRERMMKGRGAEERGLSEAQARAVEQNVRPDSSSVVRSVLEASERRGESRILGAAMRLWRGS